MNCPQCSRKCLDRPKEIMCLCMAKHFGCLNCKVVYQDWGDKITSSKMDDLDIEMYTHADLEEQKEKSSD